MFITGNEFIISRRIRSFQLFSDYVQKGLQPYSSTGKPIPPPDVRQNKLRLQKYQEKKEELERRLLTFGLPFRDRKKIEEMTSEEKIRFAQTALMQHQHSGEIGYLEEELSKTKKEIENIEKNLSAVKDETWKKYTLPDSEPERKKVIDELENALYDTEEIKKKFDLRVTIKDKERTFVGQDKMDLIHQARAETDRFYDAVKTYLKEYDLPTRMLAQLEEKEWAEGAVTVFLQQKAEHELKYIKEEHLKDTTLYKLDPGHPRRDFISALLQKIVKDHYPNNPEWWGDRQELYQLSKKQTA
jgi:hypothetical protein